MALSEERAPGEDDAARQAEEYMQAMTRAGKFSGAVLLSRNGQIVYSGGYGLADREHGAVNTPQTKFRVGSITKQFTSMAVMLLAEQGKLRFSDPISQHLPYSPAHWKDITVHHLLTHTSGLGNLAGIQGSLETTARLPLSVAELVETFRETPPEFSPGTSYRYSNSGYFLLGDIIERVSDVSYETFLQEHIFHPLAMVGSGYDRYQTILPNRATGYCKQNGEWVRASYLDMGFPFSAGALYSTVEDLHRWDQALLAGRLISGEGHARMTTPTPLLTNYGYGMEIGREAGRRTISHAGGINGFRANFVRYPDTPACVAVLCNSEEASFMSVTKALAAILFGESYEVPSLKMPIQVTAQTPALYDGVYEIMPGVSLQVAAKDGHLLVTAGNACRRFVAASETQFFCEENDDTLTFFAPSAPGRSGLTLHQSEVEVTGLRVL